MANVAPIFADYNSTTPLCSDVLTAIQSWGSTVGNLSSSHQFGQHIQHVYDVACDQIQARFNANGYALFSCSSATEANNWFFNSLFEDCDHVPRVIVSAIEHPCVSMALMKFATQGKIDLQTCRVDHNGILDLNHFSELLNDNTALVSVMLANNEIGTIQPLMDISTLAKSVGALVHSDIVQAAGKIPIDVLDLGLDAVSLSAHKCYAPVGSGVLMVNDPDLIRPMLLGGSQQQQLRAGTVNVLGLHLFSIGLDYCYRSLPSCVDVHGWAESMCDSADHLMVPISLSDKTNLWNTVPISVKRQLAHDVMMRLDMNGIGVSTGSACSTGAVETSPTIQALQLSKDVGDSIIRLSFGYPTTQEDLTSIAKFFIFLIQFTHN